MENVRTVNRIHKISISFIRIMRSNAREMALGRDNNLNLIKVIKIITITNNFFSLFPPLCVAHDE